MKATATAAAAAMLAGAAPAEEQAGSAMVSLPFNGGVSIPVTVDTAVVKSTGEHYAELYGIHVQRLATVVDTYDSNPSAGARCATGKERWVRLLDLGTRTELWHRHVESCVKGITVATPILTWKEDGTGFTVNMTSEPPLTLAIDEGGVRVVG